MSSAAVRRLRFSEPARRQFVEAWRKGGLSQSEFAQRAGISQVHVSRWRMDTIPGAALVPEHIVDETSDQSTAFRPSRRHFSATDGVSWHVRAMEDGMTSTASICPFQHSRGAPLEWIGRVVRDGLRTEISRLTALDGLPQQSAAMDLAHRVGIQAAAIDAVLVLPRRARDVLLRHYLGGESASSIARTYGWNLLRTEAEISDARERVLAALDVRFGARAEWVFAFPRR